MYNEAKAYLPTAITSDNYPVHKWFNFVAGYSPEYVRMVINDYAKKNSRMPQKIYDPFAGCATTCVVANEYNIASLGVERNPFFYKIGYTKANADTAIKEVSAICADFKNAITTPFVEGNISKLSSSAQTFLLKLFDSAILEKLLELRYIVETYSGIRYYMGFTLLSKMMEYVTTAKIDGIYRVPTSSKRAMDLFSALTRAENTMLDGFNSIISTKSKSTIVFDSSITYELIPESVDLVVFSPPYLNNFDFAEMTRMQLYFWGEASSWGDISEKHRNHMLVNTTTALKNVRADSQQMILRNSLPNDVLDQIDPIVEQLKLIRKNDHKKKNYDLLIYPYLSQMRDVLIHCYNALTSNGEVHIVLSDAAFYGIHISTEKYIQILLNSIGFKSSRIELMRSRGDRWLLDKRKQTLKKLGEYEIVAQKG